MNTVTSTDGTTIAYDRRGSGPAVIVVDGALCLRQSKEGLAELLASGFTVYNYDRRGRGDSGDTRPYAVAREIEDIATLIGEAGGAAGLYGHSSGACLALEAAAQLGDRVTRLAMYEAPYNDDPAVRGPWVTYIARLTEALADGRNGDAVALFMGFLGNSDEHIAGMRRAPFWHGLEAIAPTLAYDHTGVLGPDMAVPAARAARVPTPVLLMYGGAGAPFMRETAETLSKAMPDARLRGLDGQTHDVSPDALAPLLAGFFAS
ncbi:MAG TPA: alpha/beta hydrolase [Streptosporangiaceae bacterium]|nr:alpha/beta hydrolase [Streptosporangiaceae bacterium]